MVSGEDVRGKRACEGMRGGALGIPFLMMLPLIALLMRGVPLHPPALWQSTPPTGTVNGYITRTYTDPDGRSMTYALHIPSSHLFGPHVYPLVLLLHGGGERGNSSYQPDQNGAILEDTPYVEQWTSAAVQHQWPSFVVVPQVVDDHRWVAIPSTQGSYHLAPQPTEELLLAKEIVESLQSNYADIDAGRLYITGISMGGYGVWDAIERWPDLFAAAAPIAGGGDPTQARELISLPIWAFHGGNDGIPPAVASRAMIQAIRAAGGHPRYTEYPQAAHDIWLDVYSSPAFLSWFFAQKSLLSMTRQFLQRQGPLVGSLMLVSLIVCWIALRRKRRIARSS